MASFIKPVLVPRWADVGGNITAATEGQKDTGWLDNQIPPAGVQNEWQNLVGAWFKWVNERIADGATADEIVFNDPAAAAAMLKLAADGIRSTGGLLLGDGAGLTGVVQDGVARMDGLNVGGVVAPSTGTAIISSGLSVGFDGAAGSDAVRVGNANHSLSFVGTEAIWTFDATDRLVFDTSTNIGRAEVGGSTIFTWDSTGIQLGTGKQLSLGASGQIIGTGTSSISLVGTGSITAAVGNITTASGSIIATAGDITAPLGLVSGDSVGTAAKGIRHAIVSRPIPIPFANIGSSWISSSASNVPFLQAVAGATRTLFLTLPVTEGERLRNVSIVASGGTGIPGDVVSLEVFRTAHGANPPVVVSLGSASIPIEIGIGSFFLSESLASVYTVLVTDIMTVRINMDGHANSRIYGAFVGVDRIA